MSRIYAVAALGLALAACKKTEAPPPPKPELTVLATGDVWGQVEPCG